MENFYLVIYANKLGFWGGIPGLLVMGDDSCSRGRGFECWRRILDGDFSH